MRTAALLLVLASSLASQTPEKLFQERKLSEARVAATAQLATNKNDGGALYWMGRIANAQNKNDEAMDWLEKAVKADDKNAVYHLWLGNVVGNEAQNANTFRQPFLARRVKSEFERAVALDPTLIDARDGLISFYQQAPGFMGGSNDKAHDQIAEVRKLNPYRGHFSAANYAMRDKDYAGALKEYEAAIVLAPDSVGAFYSIANVYRRQSKWEESFAAYDRIMKAKPDELVAHLGWGAVSALSGTQYERGERELRFFLTNASLEKVGVQNLGGAHLRLGQILEKTSRRDQAKSEYAEAVKINPLNLEAKKALDGLK